MKKGNLVLFFLVGLVIALILTLVNPFSGCDEEKVVLVGKLVIIGDRYPVSAIELANGDVYWMYEPPEDFDDFINGEVQIEAILSPAYSQDIECNICYRNNENNQCPLDEELLYDVKILSVFGTGSEDYCESNDDCWCASFDGSDFYKERVSHYCDMETNSCVECKYL